MNIAIVGLGLIGGSLAKAISARTSHTVLGLDTDADTIKQALSLGAIKESIGISDLKRADVTFVCLFPETAKDFILSNAGSFAKGSIVADICGVKNFIVNDATEALAAHGVSFVGTHPMAGREFSGFQLYRNSDRNYKPRRSGYNRSSRIRDRLRPHNRKHTT